MHKSVVYVQNMMKKCKNKWNDYYILKTDVAKYFDNIDKDILYNILEKKTKDRKILWLLKQIIYSKENKVIDENGNICDKSIAIGNYTSQMFANIYLNECDRYIKEKLKVKYFSRYMDDSIAIVRTKIEAKYILKKIQEFLKVNLKLELNNKTQIFKGKQGVNYCGYKINEYRFKLRDKGKRKLKKRVKKLERLIKNGEIDTFSAYRFLTGHLGYIKIANTKNLEEKLFYSEKNII